MIRFSAALLALTLAAAFGWRVATWSWRVMAPDLAVASVDLRAETDPVGIAARPWFGTVALSTPGTSLASPGDSPNASIATGLRLVGILASKKRPAAIIGVGGAAPQVFRQGEAITEGISLRTVAIDHVIVLRSGVAERLELPARSVLSLPNHQPGRRK